MVMARIGRQRTGETELVARLDELVRKVADEGRQATLLNVGAGETDKLEVRLAARGGSFVVDRLDVCDPTVAEPHVRECWRCSAETMAPVASDTYDAVFANWVLEHIPDIAAAGRELHRVLRPGGVFFATLSNPQAPEFYVAKHTPLWFHQLFWRGRGHETHYSYGSIAELIRTFEGPGLRVTDVAHAPKVGYYCELLGLPLLPTAGRTYDRLLARTRCTRLMGDVFISFVKP
jgi:SAM-dependent methyltransferase